MGAPQARLSELGERLIDRGWRIEALTALPNYPTGEIFPGYDRALPAVEQIGRIRAVRVPMWPSKSGLAKRLASYFSFVASASAFGPGRCARPDLLYVESPPLFIGYAARYLSARWRCPYVLNVSDLWPESAIRLGLVQAGTATRLAAGLEETLYRRAAGVTGQSSEIIDAVRRRAPATPTQLVTNGVDPSRFGRDKADAAARALLGAGRGPLFIYAGLLGWAQRLDQILDVARALPAALDARFILVGDGPDRDRLVRRISDERIARVTILPAQPRERIPALLAAADVALVTLGASIPGAVPSKIYEAMASELPIVLVADGEAARRVVEAGAGLVVPPGDAGALLAACERMATAPALRALLGAAGRRAAETLYDRDRIAGQLDCFLRARLGAAASCRP
jgi:glycosyltransferase involved in cell wall biosynthesis